MFRNKKNDPPPQPTHWPRYDPGSAARLEASLNAFFAARTIADCQGPIEALMQVAGVNIGPMETTTGRSLWSWYLAWSDTTSPPDVRIRAQFALFADEYHDSFARQANAMAVAVLGKASADQLATILSEGFEACGKLDPDSQVILNHSVSAGDLQRAWSQQLNRPIESMVAQTGEASSQERAGVMEDVLSEAEAGDESQQAMVAAAVAQSEGRHDDALGYLEHGAKLGNIDAMLGAAQLARELGRPGVDRFWTEAAANAGSPVGTFNMGFNAFEEGDLAEASRWLEKSGSQGNAEAFAVLIEVAGRAQDPAAQRRWAETGASMNHPRCLEVHALNVLRGNEENPDVFRRALDLMETAARQGYAPAMDRCGIFHYHNGNPTQAKYWWEQAEAAGDPDARGRLVKYGLA